MIDFHSHILPAMDDGSKSVEMSNQMLSLLENQNVKLVCLTSHFYPSQESIEDFLRRREVAYKNLNYKGPLQLRLGSEVHYYRGISVSEDIYKLCLEGTNLLLVELPFSHAISEGIIQEIINLNSGFQVVLAHIERYDLDLDTLTYLKNNGVYLQSNCEFICSDKRAIKLLKNGYIDFLGSDCHNLSDRRPNYGDGIAVIKDKLGDDFLNHFIKKAYNRVD